MNAKLLFTLCLGAFFTFLSVPSQADATNCQPGYARHMGNCVKCKVGFHSPTGDICIRCNGNTGSNQARTKCVPCPKGTMKEGNSCKRCYPGWYQNKTGQSKCWKCPHGKYSNVRGAASCTPCPKGQYTNKVGSRSCTACPVGRYASKKGSTSCKRCPEGYYAHSTGTKLCRACRIGTTSNAGRTNCDPCRKGTYGKQKGLRFICQICLPGRTTDGTGSVGASSCKYCPPGTQANIPRDKCESCPVNWYGPSAGRCFHCPRGWYSPFKGSRKCLKCPKGLVAGRKNNGNVGYCKAPDANPIY